jgi:hypothetical protein
MFEALIKTLIEDERSEVNAISGGQAHESEDVQRAYGDKDEGLIRAIEVFLQSKRYILNYPSFPLNIDTSFFFLMNYLYFKIRISAFNHLSFICILLNLRKRVCFSSVISSMYDLSFFYFTIPIVCFT